MQGGLQFVVQRREPDGHILCRGYAGLLPSSPGLVLIVSAPTAAANSAAEALFASLDAMLLSFAPDACRANVPCNGRVDKGDLCHAHDDAACRKVLVIVGDSTAVVPPEPFFDWWLTRGPSYAVLPMLPLRAEPTKVLPRALQHLNVAYWSRSPAEHLDDVLALTELASDDRRVFISYRRHETLEIAEQLFEVLEKHRFDVFVDRFRIPPGYDFQERLTDELAHKSMILALESPTFLASPWIEYELAFAKEHELGRLAVHLPGGVPVPWLEDDYRVPVSPDELVPPILGAGAVTDLHRVGPVALDRVLSRLAEEHSRALLRRRAVMLDALRLALTMRGVTDQRFDQRGHLHVIAPAGAGGREYVVWATARPPEIDDFRIAHRVCAPGPNPAGALITPAVFREARRRERDQWLAARSEVQLRDAGRIGEIADSIAAGADL
jgi:TIR domain